MIENTSANQQQEEQPDSNQRYERIGAKLRRKREALSLDQGEVARQLHLPGMVVNDIETGQVEKLSSLYRRGYIRNYARLLELDPDEILAEAGEDAPPQLQQVLPVSRRDWRLERYLKIATYALVTVAIVPPLAYFFVAGGTRLLERDPNAGEPMEAAQAANVGEGAATVLGNEGLDRQRPSEPSKAAHVSASTLPLNPIRPAREVPAQSLAEGEEVLALPPDAAAAQAGPPMSSLELELLEDSWIEIHDAEGNRLEYDLLRSGQTRNYEGSAPFRLLLGRSSAVRLLVNGEPVTWEGHESGDIAEIAVAADGEVAR